MMRENGSVFRKITARLPELVAFCCAALMLCVIPLYFDNAFFNINRCKVSLIRNVVPWLGAFSAITLFLNRILFKEKRMEGEHAADMCMTVFALACIVSCAMQGFSESVLEGTRGRNLGLWLMLCLCLSYAVIALGHLDGKLLTGAMLVCAALCAGLGILNGAGIDPFDFYRGIKAGQEIMFFSTIGNFDFFGTYLVLMFGVAAGVLIFARKALFRILAACCSVLLVLGMLVSRTDSAVAGLLLVCLTISVLSCGDFARMAAAAALWAVCFALMPAARAVLSVSPYHPELDGLLQLLLETHAAHILTVVFLGLAALFIVLGRRRVQAPSRKLMARIVLIAVLIAFVLALCVVVWFSAFDTQTDLGGLSSFLRFDDMWGSGRGFVYTRSLRAFRDYTLTEKLFGKGLGQTLDILTPYCDNQQAIDLAGGVFTDAHCQPLQFLLTCGLVGAAAFLAFYAAMLHSLRRMMADDALLCGFFTALVSYSVVMALNVAQPILLSTYFPLCGLALSRIRRLKKGARHES